MEASPSTRPSIDGDQFLAEAIPALKQCDCGVLAKAVLKHWSPGQVCGLLKHTNVDVRRVAAVVMGMIGDVTHVPCLTHALCDTDRQVNQMAEHSLWSIWFRSGKREAHKPFRDGLSLLAADQYTQAIEMFEEAVAIDPQFAEAFNQCSIAHFLAGQYDEAIEDCRKAIRLVPTHFGAIAGMGHCFAQLGDLPLALRCYRRARRLNPQIDGINQAIERLQEKIKDSSDSGVFDAMVH